MFTTPILLASLVLPAAPQPAPRVSLVSQLSAHAASITAKETPQATEQKKDPRWDGALKGAFYGAAAGGFFGLVTYGKGGGEWPSQGPYLGATTLFGSAVGAATGLIVDLIRR